MKKFIVDRSTWYRGKGSSTSKLLNSYGEKCCVGFFAEQILQMHPTIILNKPTLYIEHKYDYQVYHLEMDISGANIYRINDDMHMSDIEREELLMEKFESLGYEVEFIN